MGFDQSVIQSVISTPQSGDRRQQEKSGNRRHRQTWSRTPPLTPQDRCQACGAATVRRLPPERRPAGSRPSWWRWAIPARCFPSRPNPAGQPIADARPVEQSEKQFPPKPGKTAAVVEASSRMSDKLFAGSRRLSSAAGLGEPAPGARPDTPAASRGATPPRHPRGPGSGIHGSALQRSEDLRETLHRRKHRLWI